MPNVAGREFPYTPQGMAAAEQYKQSLGMRGGGMMGFRPVGYRDGDLVEDTGNLGRLSGDPRLSDEDVRALEAMNVEGRRSPDSPPSDYLIPEKPDPSLIPLREPGTGLPQKVAPPRSLDLGDPVPSEFLFGTGAGVGLGTAGPVMGVPLPDALVPPGIRDALETPPRVNTEVEDLSAREPMTFSAQNNFRVVSETAETLKRLIKSFEGYAEPVKEATNAAIASGIREDLVLAALQFLGGEGTQIPTSPLLSPGEYKDSYRWNPARINPANQDEWDAYYGGGVPGSSFRGDTEYGGGARFGQNAPELRPMRWPGSFRNVTRGDPYFDDHPLPGEGWANWPAPTPGMRHGGIMSLRRR